MFINTDFQEMIFFMLFIVLNGIWVSGDVNNPVVDMFDKCSLWAEEGECLNNPNFMWTQCQPSCIKFSQDQEAECNEWAQEEECTKNPIYIQLHCPQSCNYALSWSPWARRRAKLDNFVANNITTTVIPEPCPVPFDLFSAAELMEQRLLQYISGSAGYTTGFSSSAPSEYLGMLGLTEAILYTLRVYHAARSLQEPGKPTSFSVFIGEIEATLQTTQFRSDPIMRYLPEWIKRLNNSAAPYAVRESEECHNVPAARGAPIERITDVYHPPMQPSPKKGANKGEVIMNNKGVVVKILKNGVQMPVLGLGTWQLNGEECVQAVKDAIKAGYRHIDTAQAYRNEAEVGQAIQESIAAGEVKREDLFLATKLSDSEEYAGYAGVRRLVKEQLQRLQTNYIDLYMLHSPVRGRAEQADMWRAIEDLYKEGVFRSVGVSNFDGRELRELMADSAVPPMVLQNKLDVYHVGKQLDPAGDDIVSYARSRSIVIVAYSPFSAYPFVMEPLEDPLVRRAAFALKITPAQVLLKWTIQSGFAAIPRSTNPIHMKENVEGIDLPELMPGLFGMLSILTTLVSSPVSRVSV